MASTRKHELSFFTATILDWKFLLVNDHYKDIIISSLKHLAGNKKIIVYGFAIMDNHMHILWHIVHPFRREDVQRDLLKYTAQTIIMDLKLNNIKLLQEFFVGAKDRMHQIWERNPLSIDVWSEEVLIQKLHYIHSNPVKAELCLHPEDYKYSSAAFYAEGINSFGFLTSCFMWPALFVLRERCW